MFGDGDKIIFQTFMLLNVAGHEMEHGVTELVSDVDIVREQFRIAAGMPLAAETLAAARRAASPERHAIEVRLAAEDPARAFAPAPGRIGRWLGVTGNLRTLIGVGTGICGASAIAIVKLASLPANLKWRSSMLKAPAKKAGSRSPTKPATNRLAGRP